VCGGFKTLPTHGSWGSGHYYSDVESALTDFYDYKRPQIIVQTEDNTLSINQYEDVCAKGIELRCNDEIACLFEEFKDSGEVRLLTYAEGQDEPDFVIVKGGHK
jgi:hypothetical protein